MPQEQESWHLSKSVPISLFGAMVVQALIVVWFGGQLSSDLWHGIETNRTNIERMEAELAYNRAAIGEQAIQLARIEENTRNLSEQISALVRQLERQHNESRGNR